MARKASKVRWSRLKYRDKRRLLHLVAKWFVEGKCSHAEIALKMTNWTRRNAPDCHNPDGVDVSTPFVGRRIAEAAREHGFLVVGRFLEEELIDEIRKLLPRSAPDVNIVIAPDREEMLRYAWLDFERLLMQRLEEVKPGGPAVVVAVSGGRTMLALANAAPHIADLLWREEIPPQQRNQVTVCSMTSGGVRSNIAALSDTVAALTAQYLGAQARGLLGPAWFASADALQAFRGEPGVVRHVNLVRKADFTLTSVGHLRDPNALMRQLLDESEQESFIDQYPDLADLLYNCYDGHSGKSIALPQEVADRLFSVIDLKQLEANVKKGTRCIVLATGAEKGRHALRGIFLRGLASDVYMERQCAEGLIQALQ